MSRTSQAVCGLEASLALFRRRPGAILRIHYRADRLDVLRPLLAWAARERLPYRELDDEGLSRVGASAHHGGVVIVAQPLRFTSLAPERPAGGGRWMALDGVENPHNLGAILRTCAFFGLDGVLAGGVQPGETLSAAALRVAEGGAEHLVLCGVPALAPALAELARRGVEVIGLETDAPRTLAAVSPREPWLLAAGHERAGLAPAVRAACTHLCRIEGAGNLGSLNVSVSAGVALYRLCGLEAVPARGGPRPAGAPGAGPAPAPQGGEPRPRRQSDRGGRR
ncbi:MAG: RNA methyltransferase [Candidatus Lambdaproteobacteria bacterium]|nr:RNA methyltransferase [Candidatus Lambdaproteobacteria bacterium]